STRTAACPPCGCITRYTWATPAARSRKTSEPWCATPFAARKGSEVRLIRRQASGEADARIRPLMLDVEYDHAATSIVFRIVQSERGIRHRDETTRERRPRSFVVRIVP